MVKKKKAPATKKKKPQTKKPKKKDFNFVIAGIIIIFISIFSFFKFGWLGSQLANCYQFFVGETVWFAAIATFIIGFGMIIYEKLPKLSAKRYIGFGLAYLFVLCIISTIYFNKIGLAADYLGSFLHSATEGFKSPGSSNFSGGILGVGLFTVLNPLVGNVGIYLISAILIMVGLLLFFDVSFASFINIFQDNSKKVINQTQDVVENSKQKYSDFVEKKKQKVEHNVDFPNTTDFDNQTDNSKKSTPTTENSISKPDFHEVKKQPEKQVTQVHPENKQSTDSTELEDNKYADFSRREKFKSQAETDSKPVLAQDEKPKASQLAEIELPKTQTMEESLEQSSDTSDDITAKTPTDQTIYHKPPLDLLTPSPVVDQSEEREFIEENKEKLRKTFESFGVKVEVKKADLGPSVTKYEVQPDIGVKVSKIVNLADDLALALAAKDIRIEAPIPGKPYVGIEVPNKQTLPVYFRESIEKQDAEDRQKPLSVPLGKDVTGEIISADLTKMPHLLIAGSTGSGKSVSINAIITSLLMKTTPDELKLILIDPKMVELSVYNGIAHLMIPVVTDAKKAANALKKAVKEMERRYELFAASGVRNMTEYNHKVEQNNEDTDNPVMTKLPYIVVIIDELSDLMMVAGNEVESAIVRLAQMARAAGIHMIIATQRPSVDVITGLIKANVPSRIAFAVSSGIDSRTILDSQGAEKLLGHGDMLFVPIGSNKPTRIQASFISVEEVERVVDFVAKQKEVEYDEKMLPNTSGNGDHDSDEPPEDEYYDEAVALVQKQRSASVSMLQRRFRIGYNRAARLIDEMEDRGVVGPYEGSKPRKVYEIETNQNETEGE
ncbi:DNA translocase FtsK 4TM domain-containing protein [Holzapfeliella sp. JNUCC 80]